jgi:anaerobic magnesium-protoporphyrin IX monomethyl ester cyclase
MKRILLLNPPLDEKERSGALAAATGRSIPYGLISLAAVIRNEGYNVSFLDSANFGYNVKETVDRILTINPDYLGITTVTLSVDRTSQVADLLKLKNRRMKIIVGGAHLSSVPEETMKRFCNFDIGVIGEGEETIIELLKTLDNKTSLKNVKGIIYREGGEIIRTEKRSMIKNLDSLPLPAWDIVPDMLNVYRPSAPSYLRLPSTTIVTSRGCFGKCIFCNSKMIHGGLRCFSAEYVLKMIRYLVKNYKIKDLSIYDDNFVFSRERVEKICKTILDEKIDITWSCYSRVDQGNLELFRLMKKAGCWQISYGIESGSQRILDLIKKNVTLEKIENTVVDTNKAGLRTRGFFIIGHFTEDKDSILQTINFMKKILLDDFHFTTFTPLPGTAAYEMADKYGKFDKTWSKMNLQYPVFIPNGLTAEEIESYSKLAYRSFYFRPKIIASYLFILFKHPKNAKRLLNALQSLLLRIFSKKHIEFMCRDGQFERDK